MVKGFRAISIREELVQKIEEIMKESGGVYRSIADFIAEAVRLRIEQLNKSKVKAKESETR